MVAVAAFEPLRFRSQNIIHDCVAESVYKGLENDQLSELPLQDLQDDPCSCVPSNEEIGLTDTPEPGEIPIVSTTLTNSSLIGLCYASRVTDVANICSLLSVEVTTTVHASALDDIARDRGSSTGTQFVRNLVYGFLRGSGIPCPDAFRTVAWSFPRALVLDNVDFDCTDTRCRLRGL